MRTDQFLFPPGLYVKNVENLFKKKNIGSRHTKTGKVFEHFCAHSKMNEPVRMSFVRTFLKNVRMSKKSEQGSYEHDVRRTFLTNFVIKVVNVRTNIKSSNIWPNTKKRDEKNVFEQARFG